jgi:hypothetical protein
VRERIQGCSANNVVAKVAFVKEDKVVDNPFKADTLAAPRKTKASEKRA